MLPLSLDLSRLRLALVANGASALHRLRWLEEAGAKELAVFSAKPSPELTHRCGIALVEHLPDAAALAGVQLVFVAGVDEPERTALAALARGVGALVYVEDSPALSDLQAPAVLRRGDLTIAVSTNGRAPGLAAELKQFLACVIGPAWRDRLDELHALRGRWRAAGAANEAIRRLTAARLARQGWLPGARLLVAANDARKRSNNERGGESCR
jgi:precorrin-2 dehydrogenase / sirohydrochlorin ferrochelatase